MATSRKEKNSLKMSIQVSLNGLSFCIVNPSEQKIVLYRKIQFQNTVDPAKIVGRIAAEYEREKALQEVENLQLIFSNTLYTLVPKPFFKEENTKKYLKYSAKVLKTDFIAYDFLETHNLVNTYIPYTNITNYFFEKYGEFEYKHGVTILVKSLLENTEPKETNVYLYNHFGYFDLVVIQNQQLLFCNSFVYYSPEDFLYYLLFSAEQLNLNPDMLKLVLLGNISIDSDVYKITYKYIRNIRFMEGFQPFSYDEKSDHPEKEREEFLLLNSLL